MARASYHEGCSSAVIYQPQLARGEVEQPLKEVKNEAGDQFIQESGTLLKEVGTRRGGHISWSLFGPGIPAIEEGTRKKVFFAYV